MKNEKRQHSPWGGSSAYRYLHCPGSVRACLHVPPEPSSVYALEGRAAHYLAQDCLRKGLDPTTRVGLTYTVPSDGPDGPHIFEVEEEMAEAVGLYVDYVCGLPGTRIVEAPLDMEWFQPGMHGTADCIVQASGRNELWVIDYKHGRGVEVDSQDNEQLRVYALGAMQQAKWAKKDTTLHLVIVQPRAGRKAIREETISVGELLEWARKVLRPGIDATTKPDAPRCSGPQCRWCDARGSCQEVLKRNCELAKVEFGDPDPTAQLVKPSEMPLEDLGRVVAVAESIQQWVGAVLAYALKRALEGEEIPGCKLVEKRAMRRWVDAEDAMVAECLEHAGINPYDKKLVSVAEAERRAKKAEQVLPEELWEKRSSGYRLVVEEDTRPQLSSQTQAEIEFGAIEEE